MIRAFVEAAFSWIIMGLFVAISCVFINKRKKSSEI